MTEPFKVPLRVDYEWSFSDLWIVRDTENNFVTYIHGRHSAAALVRAVNAHDRLRAMLVKARWDMANSGPVELSQTIANIDALLAEIDGERNDG